MKYDTRERKAPRMINPAEDARYDHVYVEGMKWLDGLAGEPLQEGEYIVQFSDEMWRSSTRKGNDDSDSK